MPSYRREELNCRLVVGMEVHVELATRTKMWTSAPNVAHRENFEAEPNTLLDPVVIGMPGTLPVMNKAAVEMSMLVGLAFNCQIAEYTKWDRKSYYYPDLPKNYQISQYDLPLCFDGAIDIPVGDASGNLPDAGTKRIGIIRAHLEEDAGKLLHEGPGGVAISGSIVDLNRAGTPLLEIVTEPDFGSADEVVTFCNVLRDICRHLGVTEGIMQKGHMRFEPNINVVIETPDGKTHKTPVVEIKNLNSFRAVHGAIVHESERQVEEWLETGKEMGAGAKSTRGWDDVKGVTTLQREKEDAHDYRYFPDPDLVSVTVDAAWLESVKERLVELPLAKRARYVEELGLKEEDATALVDEPAASRFFEAVLDAGGDARKSAAMLLNSGVKRCNEQACTLEELGITAEQVVEVMRLIAEDKVSSGAADKLFGLCCESGETAEALAEANGLMQVSDDSALEGWVDEVLANPGMAKAIEDIKAGKGKAIGALMGQVMKLSKGSANPKRVTEMIRTKLGA
ncbi:MAG: Asp-tRNA(Asn)/Glu-tRNA(Gln) amidotransferase subunit GatB [Planctomycetota bacterium]